MSTPFRDALALRPTGEGSFAADLGTRWTIGPKAHGGILLALCAAAARLAHAGDGHEPVAVSASFLAPPDPGPVTLDTELVKRGRTVSVVEVVLRQDGRPAVRATVTLGRIEDGAALLPPAPSRLAVTPPPAAIDVAGTAMAAAMTLAGACDLRLDPAGAPFVHGGTDPTAELALWVRPHGEDPDLLFALMAADVAPPVTLNLGRAGWAPTVQLTAYLRGRPAPGWLRVAVSSTSVGDRWFDEDAVVLDSAGSLVCHSRQLALVPPPDAAGPGGAG